MKWYLTWSLIREHISQVHPLIYSEHLFKDLNIQKNEVETNTFLKKLVNEVISFHQERLKSKRKERMSFIINSRDLNISFNKTLIGDKDDYVYVNHASLMLLNFGQATIEARGKWIQKAHFIATSLMRKFSYIEPKINRMDTKVKHPVTNRDVREVAFQIESYSL